MNSNKQIRLDSADFEIKARYEGHEFTIKGSAPYLTLDTDVQYDDVYSEWAPGYPVAIFRSAVTYKVTLDGIKTFTQTVPVPKEEQTNQKETRKRKRRKRRNRRLGERTRN